MMTADPIKLEDTVYKLCADVNSRLRPVRYVCMDERLLWEEMVCCILSSQVPYSAALSATEYLSKSGLLPCDFPVSNLDEYEESIASALLEPVCNGKRYRFPILRAKQLSSTAMKLKENLESIVSCLSEWNDIHVARKYFIKYVDGFGPKQTSMYLRNIGYTDNIAVLDRHILSFMELIGEKTKDENPTSLTRYEKIESDFINYSDTLGYSPACVDWSIWIVMRTNMSL